MRLALTCAAAWFLAATAALAGEPPKPPAETVVLDLNQATFRAFIGWKTPTLISPDGKLKPLLERKRKELKDEDRKPVPMVASGLPAANWATAEFDDSAWPKLEINHPSWNPRLLWVALAVKNPTGYMTDPKYQPSGPYEGNLVCLRSTFRVSDPAQAANLKLTLGYFGGAIVYVNGAELARGHLPEGKLAFDTFATRYPDEAYVTADNKFRGYWGGWIYGYYEDPRCKPGMLEGLKFWRRDLPAKGAADGVAIPPAMLRKGVNVIAIEVHTAPVNELVYEKTVGNVTWAGDVQWPHAMVVEAKLTAPTPAGLDLNDASAGLQIVNNQPIETVFTNELALPGVQVRPIRIVGARNGFFSGKVAVTSPENIKGLKASVSDLAGADGKARIPATAIQVRRAEAATPNVSWIPTSGYGHAGGGYFDRLLADFPVDITALPVGNRKQAIAPVWVTVQVPADAAAGEYKGTLTVEADGAAAKLSVPVELKVHDWKVPDPKDFVIHHNIYQSPDSVARYYNVPMWSDKHFELMGKSLAAFRQVGNRICVASLLADSFTLGNSEGLVRWVKKADGGYDYDFTNLDKYLELYEKTCGKPGVLRLDAWQRVNEAKSKAGQKVQNVSVFDPATGKVTEMPQPDFGTPENEAFWRPVLVELKKRLDKRGWYDVAAFGWVHYSKPADPSLVDVFKKIWPDGKWMHTAHTFPSEYQGTTKDVKMPVLCSEGVWGVGGLYDPDARIGQDGQRQFQRQGFPQYPQRWQTTPKNVFLGFPRQGVSFVNNLCDNSRLAEYRLVTEGALQGNICGLGYLGGDFWPVQSTGEKKRLVRVSYGGSGIDMSDAIAACFSPGPDGAIFNERMEMFREGVQVGEAILYLERALEDKKVSADGVKKIGGLLDERSRYYLRAFQNYKSFECSNWQERDDRLFALCAEVAKAAGK
ncbi:MAG TPA: DUF6067 family protein [Planctomycetota bacterium]|nr:DUF6067 family protein [Planctomycetota bacterium]